jgi:putative nucleotidyltransferase with HDIG domain
MCQTIGLYEQAGAEGDVAAVVADIGFRQPSDVHRLRELLAQPREAGAPIVVILQSDRYADRIQAAAVGATSLFPPSVSFSDLALALAPVIRSPGAAAPAASLMPARSVEQAQAQFATMFAAAARGEPPDRRDIDHSTSCIVAAIAERGIRQWLEIVWTYDDATYQHCLLVTGLAAAFARSLQCSQIDQEQLTRGALLHDIGKARIPLAILNKPGALTSEELAVMRTHPVVGHDLLRQQGDYEPELLEVVLRHHELLDGSGYPDAHGGAQIPDLVRLVTICDIYAALIEHRPYRAPMTAAQAFKILQDMEGKVEGILVRAFARVAENISGPDPDQGLRTVAGS